MSTNTAGKNQVGGKRHPESQFIKVRDGRKHSIRGLWKRNERFYAQLTVFDPIAGKHRVQRILLMDKLGEPVVSVAQAVAVMEGLRTKRRDTGLDAQLRRAPKFGDYADRYLDAISAGSGAKKHRVIIGERAILKQWRKHLGDIRLDQLRKVQVNDFITKGLKVGRRPRTCNLDVIILRNVINRANSTTSPNDRRRSRSESLNFAKTRMPRSSICSWLGLFSPALGQSSLTFPSTAGNPGSNRVALASIY